MRRAVKGDLNPPPPPDFPCPSFSTRSQKYMYIACSNKVFTLMKYLHVSVYVLIVGYQTTKRENNL